MPRNERGQCPPDDPALAATGGNHLRRGLLTHAMKKPSRTWREPARKTQIRDRGAPNPDKDQERDDDRPWRGSRPVAVRLDRRDRAGLPPLIAWLVLCCLSIWPFLPSLNGQFIWDDQIISGSPAGNGWEGLRAIWSLGGENGNEHHYWPITYLSFWIEDQLWGLGAVFMHHAVNLGLHAINCLLAYTLLRGIGLQGAFLAAAIFAVHPVHAVSVAWISGRKDMLAGVFFFSSALMWFRHLDATRLATGRAMLVASLLLYGCAMLSKTTAVTLPAILLIVTWWLDGRVTRTIWLSLLPFFVVGLAWGLIETEIASATTYLIDVGLAPLDRIVLIGQTLVSYASLALWPIELAILYPKWDVDASDPWQWVHVTAVVGLFATLWVLRQRVGRGWLAALAVYGVVLLPVLGLVDFGYLPYTFVADRYQYIALLVPSAVLATIAARSVDRYRRIPRSAGYGAAAMVIVGLGVLSWRQAAIYEDEFTLFSHINTVNPGAYPAQEFLALHSINEGMYDAALAYSLGAIETHNRYYTSQSALAHFIAGAALHQLERHGEALPYLDDAHRRQPQDRQVIELLARSNYHQQRFGASIDHLDELEMRLKVLPPPLLALRADARLQLAYLDREGDGARVLDEADADITLALEESVERDQRNGMHIIAARIDIARGQPKSALAHIDRAIALDPSPAAHRLAVAIHIALDNHARAAEHARLLLASDPNNVEYRQQLDDIANHSPRAADGAAQTRSQPSAVGQDIGAAQADEQ